MKIFIGADHGGFYLKEKIEAHLVKAGYDVEDVGDRVFNPTDDYPQFAYAAVTKVLGSEDDDPRAILICRSGQGVAMAANRVHGIRAVVIDDVEEAKMARNDDNSNILALPARKLEKNEPLAFDIIDAWIKTPFSGAERHVRRLREIEEIYG